MQQCKRPAHFGMLGAMGPVVLGGLNPALFGEKYFWRTESNNCLRFAMPADPHKSLPHLKRQKHFSKRTHRHTSSQHHLKFVNNRLNISLKSLKVV